MTNMSFPIPRYLFLLAVLLGCTACFRYSFSGVSIPNEVQTIFIPFFPNQAPTAVPGLPDQINTALIDRFVNQSRLRLSNDRNLADAVIDGVIVSYSNKPFSIASNERASLNRVEIAVRATFKYRTEDQPKWNKNFSGFGEYDPAEDPIGGENEAAQLAIQQLVENMFNEALGGW
jgi:hypothetical protein